MWPSQMLLPVISIKTYVADVSLMGRDTAAAEIKHAPIQATCAAHSPNYLNGINCKATLKSVFG